MKPRQGSTTTLGNTWIIRCRSYAIWIVAVAMFLVAVPACGGGDDAETVSQQINAEAGGAVSFGDDLTIRIPAGGLSDDAVVTITMASEENQAPAQHAEVTSLGQRFNIEIGGKELLKEAVLEMKYDPDLLTEDTVEGIVFLAHYSETLQQWVPVEGTVDAVEHIIVVETSHLSWWQPASWDLSELVDKTVSGLTSLLVVAGLPEAEIPQCNATLNYKWSTSNDSLLACVEETSTEGHALLRLANNRAFAILVDPPPNVELRSPLLRGPLFDAVWELLVDTVRDDVVYIPPAGEAEFSLRFEEPGETLSLLSDPSRVTLAIDMLLKMTSSLLPDVESVVKVKDGVECVIASLAAEGSKSTLISDVLDVAKACVGQVLEGVFAQAWNFVQNLVTIGSAVGELVVEQFISGGHNSVTVTYSPLETVPPGAGPGPADQDPPTEQEIPGSEAPPSEQEPPGSEALTLQVSLIDNSFVPDQLDVRAGQNFVIRLINPGENPHNLRITGPDGQYDSDANGHAYRLAREDGTDCAWQGQYGNCEWVPLPVTDDLLSTPDIEPTRAYEPFGGVIPPSETGQLSGQINEPGVYEFRCDIHLFWGSYKIVVH